MEHNLIAYHFSLGGARHGSARQSLRRLQVRRTASADTAIAGRNTVATTVDDRLASRTPVARFLAQFNQDNVATLPAKLKDDGEQKYDLHFPQASGDLTLDVAAKAAADVPAATVSTASLTAAIEAVTSKSLADLYAADAATSQRNAIWDNYYAFYVLSRYEGQEARRPDHQSTHLPPAEPAVSQTPGGRRRDAAGHPERDADHRQGLHDAADARHAGTCRHGHEAAGADRDALQESLDRPRQHHARDRRGPHRAAHG